MEHNDLWRKLIFTLGDFELESGQVLMQAKLYYHQIGALNAQKDNLIIMPTYYGGLGIGNRGWVDDPLSPLHNGDYCIVIPCLFGAGESSSPSNTAGSQQGGHFPDISYLDNVRAQRELIRLYFEDANPRLVVGWSMGGMQALQWAKSYPEKVKSVLAICATAKCYPHNEVFLEGLASCLTSDRLFYDGHYRAQPLNGLVTFAKVYAGWAYSQAFYRQGLYTALGFDTKEALLNFWVNDHLNQDANDLLIQLRTWQNGNVLENRHDPEVAVEPLRCPTIFMPSTTDLYFTETDAKSDAELLGAQCIPIESDFGHVAGGPGRLPNESQAIYKAMATLLAKTA